MDHHSPIPNEFYLKTAIQCWLPIWYGGYDTGLCMGSLVGTLCPWVKHIYYAFFRRIRYYGDSIDPPLPQPRHLRSGLNGKFTYCKAG